MPSDPALTPPSGQDGLVLADIDPAAVRRIHLVGIAGSGMAAFAGMLKAAGYEVTGSDQGVFRANGEKHDRWVIRGVTH